MIRTSRYRPASASSVSRAKGSVSTGCQVGAGGQVALVDLLDHLRRRPALGHLDRRLDHGEREALDAEPVGADVAQHHLEQPVGQLLRVGVILQQFYEMRLRRLVELLVLPQRVVGIEADRREARRSRHGDSSWLTFLPPPAPHFNGRTPGRDPPRLTRVGRFGIEGKSLPRFCHLKGVTSRNLQATSRGSSCPP